MAARYLIEFEIDRKVNRGRPGVSFDRDRIVLGSRPTADVHVADRLVPQEALAFIFDGRRLRMEVLATIGGAFVDGAPVEGTGAVASGSSVQVGHTIVRVAIDGTAGTCTLTVGERYLSKTVEDVAKKAQAGFALVESGPQEHRWGKSPHLARWSWIAAFAGALVLGAAHFLRDSDLLSRGPLHESHRIGAPGGPTSCFDCHAPFASDHALLCAKCHVGYDAAAHHPYGAAATMPCAHCHGDHRADTATSLLPPMTSGDGGWPATCSVCHDDVSRDEKVAAAAADPEIARRVRDRPGEPAERPLRVDGFSHADHRIAKPRRVGLSGSSAAPDGAVPVPCGKCHVRGTAGSARDTSPADFSPADFATVTYESCLACHADWRVDVHGRDQGGAHCVQCHEAAADPATIARPIRRVTVPGRSGLFRVPARRHDLSKDDCRSCHLSDRPASAPAPAAVRRFRHDHHLRTVTPEKGGALDLAASCVPCHTSVAGSTSLAALGGELPPADLSGCADCHTDGAPEPVAGGAAGPRTVVDMVHALHVVEPGAGPRAAPRTLEGRESLARGCLACHTPVEGDAPMTLRDGVGDCSACHAGHEHLGSGKCALCHVDRTAAVNRDASGATRFRTIEAGLFDRAKATVRRSPSNPRFDHFSPGHAGPASDATTEGCGACHATDAVDRSVRVLDVPLPGHADRPCVLCHVRERYHR